MDNPNDKPVIYVGGLDDQVDDNTLHSAFIPFGEIKTIEMPLDHNTGKLIYFMKFFKNLKQIKNFFSFLKFKFLYH